MWGYRGGSHTAVQAWRTCPAALCGSCPLVFTPYLCRLGDLVCLFCAYPFLCILLSVHTCILLFLLFDFSFVAFPSDFDTVGWVFWPVKTYIVLVQTLNHAQSINQSVYMSWHIPLITTLNVEICLVRKFARRTFRQAAVATQMQCRLVTDGQKDGRAVIIIARFPAWLYWITSKRPSYCHQQLVIRRLSSTCIHSVTLFTAATRHANEPITSTCYWCS